MPGGRRTKHQRKARPELQEIVRWFKLRLQAEDLSIHSFISQAGRAGYPLPKNAVYEFFRGERLLNWRTTASMAVALRQNPEAIRPMWRRAKRVDAGQVRPRVQVVGWDELPIPDERLRELLTDQLKAADPFPYSLLSVSRPALSEIHVEQDVRPAVSRSSQVPDEERRRIAEPPAGVPLRQALADHDHLFITGGPGSGKTTMGRLLVRQVAHAWLSVDDDAVLWCPEPVIGLRIHAAGLLTARSWAEVLADATRTATLTAPLDPHVFTQLTYGVRWLVVVDGLDEIPSAEKRKEVLRSLAVRSDRGMPYRLIITSRPLPQEELEPLHDRAVGFYTLSGFDGSRQRDFARRWFTAQGVADAAAASSTFLEQTEAAGVSELLKVPLLATVTASFYTRNPGKSLPRGRIELYEKFLDDLANARRHHVDIRDRIRTRWDELGCVAAADWILAQQDRLITYLAQVEITRQSPLSLSAAAASWVRGNLPDGLRLREGMEGDLERLLAETGVLVSDEAGLSFLHRSFAEFIAAKQEAAEIPAEFPGLADWKERIANEASRNYVLFTFAHWARREGNAVATIVRMLLAEDLQHRIMALRLVTAGVPMGAELEQAVIDRLLGEPLERSWTSSENKVFTALTELRGNERLAERLRQMTRTEGLPTSLRAAAAAAYARVADLPGGVHLLHDLAERVDHPADMIGIAAHLAVLDAPATEVRAVLLKRALAGAHGWQRVQAMSELVELGEVEGIADLARSMLSSDEQNGDLLRFAGEAWLAAAGDSAVPQMAEAIEKRSHTNEWAHAGLAQLFLDAGNPSLAEPHARETLLNSTSDEDIRNVVEAYVETCGAEGAARTLTILRDYVPWNGDERSNVAEQLVQLGHPEQAVELARIVLRTPGSGDPFALARAAEVLFSVLGAAATEEALYWLRQHRIRPHYLSGAMHDRVRRDDKDTACLIAHWIIQDAGAPNSDFLQAADVLLRHGGSGALNEVTRMMRARPAGSTALAAGLLPLLVKHEHEEAAVALSREVLVDPGRTIGELQAAVRAWIRVAGRGRIPQIVALVQAASGLTGDERAQLAVLLEEMGDANAAVELWCAVSVEPSLSTELRWRAAEHLLRLGAAERAVTALTASLAVATDAAEARRLRQLIGWVAPTGHAALYNP
ncbi:NACHT domain-containing protein [Microbispora sp. NPDC046933]|uniref:NACHT domain-containing protein n=1 Tax=Microbispora sp. NPDC046933 TaxID=3155618 RepID=UPI0033E53FAD